MDADLERSPAWRACVEALDTRLARAFAAVLADLVDGPELDHRPAAGGWTRREIGDHLCLTNHFLLILIGKLADKGLARARRGERPPAEPPSFEALEKLGTRALPWAHPEHMTPRAERPLPEIRSELERQERECRAALEAAPAGEGCLHGIRMSVVGDERLDLYQYLCIVALHLERHARQMQRA